MSFVMDLTFGFEEERKEILSRRKVDFASSIKSIKSNETFLLSRISSFFAL